MRNAAELDAILRADDTQPLIGVFADGNMAVRWTGPRASYHGNIDKPAITCQPNPACTATAPDLATMTRKAIAFAQEPAQGLLSAGRRHVD